LTGFPLPPARCKKEGKKGERGEGTGLSFLVSQGKEKKKKREKKGLPGR